MPLLEAKVVAQIMKKGQDNVKLQVLCKGLKMTEKTGKS